MPRESGASSNHRVMCCAPAEITWLLDRPLSRAMTLLRRVAASAVVVQVVPVVWQRGRLYAERQGAAALARMLLLPELAVIFPNGPDERPATPNTVRAAPAGTSPKSAACCC